nr:hypothetical protein CTI12_AA226560 [Tanacetum cinerariifolium]
TNASVDPPILKRRECQRRYYQRCKQKKIVEANADMEAPTPVGATHDLLALSRETTLDDQHGSNVLLPLFNQEYNQTMDMDGFQQSRGPSEGYSYPVCTMCGCRHPGECRRAAGTCFKCGQTGHLQKDCK